MRRSRRRGLAKERLIMIASSLLVLASLTATGIWLGRDNGSQDEGYVVDLSSIENSQVAGLAEEDNLTLAESVTQGASTDDLDYDPYFQETNSQKVENPDESESNSMSDTSLKEDVKTSKENQKDTPALSTAMQPALTFSDSDTLIWPIVGNILINYSMDKTVFFSTLEQYKYNPAVIIQANEGDLITASSAGNVISVFKEPQIGKGNVVELGGGYEVTYGIRRQLCVSSGYYCGGCSPHQIL